MEEHIAIMMADLSGYTAMTETHGPISAADLIDKYVEIVEASLVGRSQLHERTGDEVMVVSPDADDLMATAMKIIGKTAAEENFLQLHGGLHYGSVLKRKNSFFGSTLNVASRIASNANPGTFWFSEEFLKELTDFSFLPFTPLGRYSFKNVSEEIELFEFNVHDGNSVYIDPVCRMMILDLQSATAHPDLSNVYFCSAACMEKFGQQLKFDKKQDAQSISMPGSTDVS
jgi:class 3 adenylate cyclase/YHS domain-containing protein